MAASRAPNGDERPNLGEACASRRSLVWSEWRPPSLTGGLRGGSDGWLSSQDPALAKPSIYRDSRSHSKIMSETPVDLL